MEPRYNEVLGTMKISLLYQAFHIRIEKQRNIKIWDQQNYLVIRGFCYIRPRYNEVPLYYKSTQVNMHLHCIGTLIFACRRKTRPYRDASTSTSGTSTMGLESRASLGVLPRRWTYSPGVSGIGSYM